MGLTERRSTRNGRSTRTGRVSAVVVVTSALVLAALPLFLVGGLAVQIREDFGLSKAEFGAGVTIGFLVGALSAPLGGLIADRIGPRSSTFIGISLSGLALVGLGAGTTGWITMVVFLCLAGLAIAATDPGLVVLVDRTVPVARQGLAFGIKEASIPAATLAAGIAVPAIALTVGWRWAFAVGLVPLLVVVTLLPRLEIRARVRPHHREVGRASPTKRMGLLLAALGAALGTAAASGVGIFLTDSAVTMGMSPASAGILLAVGSVTGIVTRVAAGAVADRVGGPQFELIAGMLAVGAVTMALGGSGNTVLLVIGTIGAFTGGWAWTGLFFLSLLKTNPDRPGAVAGVGITGLGVGNSAGPWLFGLAADSLSAGAAWVGAAITAGVAALLMWMARSKF